MSFILKQIPRAFLGVSPKKSKLLKSFMTSIEGRSFSSKIDEDMKKYLKLAFVQADKDKDGQVSAEEMKQVIKMFFMAKGKPENPVVYSFFEKIIFQDKPTLSQEEMLNRVDLSWDFVMGVLEDCLKNKFSQFDSDKDGKLSKEETSKLFGMLQPFVEKEQVDQFLSKYDKDKDGNISLEEAVEFSKKVLQKKLFVVK